MVYPGPYPPQGWWAPPPQPGCIPLRPLNVGDYFAGTIAVMRRNAKHMLVPAGALGLLGAVMNILFQVREFDLFNRIRITDATGTSPGTVDLPVRDFVELFAIALPVGFLTVVLSLVVIGTLVTVVADDVVGYRAPPAELWRRVRPSLLRLFGLSFIVGLAEVIGLLFCIAPGVWLWGIWAVAIPALVIERSGVFAAMGRSNRLVSGTFWRAWGIRALGYLVAYGVGSVITTPLNFLAFGAGGLNFSIDDDQPSFHISPIAVVLLALGTAIAQTVILPLITSFETLLYIDLRMRKENLAPWLIETSQRR